jgi:hypothetical protein
LPSKYEFWGDVLGLDNVRQSADAGSLVIVLGAGATMSLMPKSRKALSWVGLVKSALTYGHERKLVSDAQFDRYTETLTSDDVDDLLGAAEFAGRKLGAPTDPNYARWLRATFEDWAAEPSAMTNALRAIAQKNILIATLNYDTVTDSAVSLAPINLTNTEAVLEWCRKEREGILHLHGVWNDPGSCVFGIRDYHAAVQSEARDLVQRSLSSFNRLLFVGCGDTFADPNFSGLIGWLREHVGAGAPQHYALVRDDEVPRRMADTTWRGFVEPLGYGEHHSDLPTFLLDCFPTRPASTTPAARAKASAARDHQVIAAYRQFLLRDCGEMTIEGMRADMDTAQRKFDLEKLFVPLEIQEFEPAISLDDPERETALQQWREEHGKPLDFAKGFSKHKKIALLALPGGGKTMLLKRLAVAYADPKRREASPDQLPDLDLVPVMIRCREWKDHIRKPLQTLLQEIASITGEQKLDGLAQALERPLKAGNVLLLVDGLDEIHDDADRAIFVENLEKFLDTYSKIRIVVSSREAGFDLVAPCLKRFCSKFKIAPLNETAIRALNEHWHRLMSGGTPEASAEATTVAEALLREPLLRLAENPLLLTMLLVVKHGAGRLPPDRVSLYERAVEVLLDTWNIKGHAALDSKEAVPHLACLALELMRRGQQTATEREIIGILEDARAKLPTVGRYARDAAHEFLKRVELRSSLLLQGGHTNEDGKNVPFYQFRHLTFQEYLAAFAVVEGYVLDGGDSQSIVSNLGENVLSDEWKEVVPMAAVLARNQAAPLLEVLTVTAEADAARRREKSGDSKSIGLVMPAAPARLRQAMVEEAIFPPSIAERAAGVITYFFSGVGTSDSWKQLGSGPYGPELRDAALKNYIDGHFVARYLARNALASLEALGRPLEYWRTKDSVDELLSSLNDEALDQIVSVIAAIGGSYLFLRNSAASARSPEIYDALERRIFDDRPEVQYIAIWCWGFWRHLRPVRDHGNIAPSNDTMLRLGSLFLEGLADEDNSIGFIFSELQGTRRGQYYLTTNVELVSFVRSSVSAIENDQKLPIERSHSALRLAYLMPEIFSDDQIKATITKLSFGEFEQRRFTDIAEYFGLSKPYKRPARPLTNSRARKGPSNKA